MTLIVEILFIDTVEIIFVDTVEIILLTVAQYVSTVHMCIAVDIKLRQLDILIDYDGLIVTILPAVMYEVSTVGN